MLTKEETKRYQKQILLEDVGLLGQMAIKKASVLVIGAGGLGCPVLQYLTAAGAGKIGVVDFDKVEISNLHRQVLYSAEDVGKSKVEVSIQKLLKLNPFVELIPHEVRIDRVNALELVSAYDLVIDGSDNFQTRYIVNDACVQAKKPLVYGSILGYQGQIALFNYQGSKDLRALFPDPPDPADVPSCSENGVLGIVPSIIGSMMVQEAINVMLGRPALQNKFLLVDCLANSITKIDL